MPGMSLAPAAPSSHRETQMRQHLRAGRPERAEAQHRHAPVGGQRRRLRAPFAVLTQDMTIHPQMMAQDMAGHPFHHALRQAMIDHPGQRDLQRRVADDILDPRPKVEHRLGAGIGREILHLAVGGIDDVIDIFRRGTGREGGVDTGRGKRLFQRCLVGAPVIGARGEKDIDGHGLTSVCGHSRSAQGRSRSSGQAWRTRHS